MSDKDHAKELVQFHAAALGQALSELLDLPGAPICLGLNSGGGVDLNMSEREWPYFTLDFGVVMQVFTADYEDFRRGAWTRANIVEQDDSAPWEEQGDNKARWN